MDLRLSTDPYESFRIFQGRILEQYLAMSSEFKFMIIDANQSIEAQQNVVRTLVAGKLDLPSFAWKSAMREKLAATRLPQN
jgi:dTMP kinase